MNIRSKETCQFDLVTLGEILLRFDPGQKRIHNARSFEVWDGGAEYNVAANLSRVFRQRASIATTLVDNPLGRLAEDLARQSGVDTSLVKWTANGRNGLYFIERGQGLRAPRSAFDREHTAVSGLKAGDIDWRSIFDKGVRWFHTGGVFAGLSDTTPEVAAEAMAAAKRSGSIVSFDLNYRDSLWRKRGGRETANELNARLLHHADIVFGTFGFDSKLSDFDVATFRASAAAMQNGRPDLKIIVSTLRETHTASRHDLGAACLSSDETVTVARDFRNIEVIDRVGSGDAFVSGFIHSLLEARDLQFALDCGVAHGALAMTTPGDVSMSTAEEVYGVMNSADAAAER